VEITEVRIKLMEDAGERLQGFCSITFDHCFVVRDLKIIEGVTGPFVAMPSRKLTAHCPGCGCKNHLRAAYCNQCGKRLKDDRVPKDDDGRAKLYADIAHPINSACRELIQEAVIRAFREEVEIERPARRPKPAARETVTCEKTHLEPAETVPRGPHTVSAQPQLSQNSNKQGAFGAGIW
jgi:stage V sporulation protein G